MSDEERSTPDERAALLAEVNELVRRETADTNAAMARPVRRVPFAAVAAWTFAAANLVFWLLLPPAPAEKADRRSPVEIERDLRHALAAAAAEVETWRAAHDGRLPGSLAEAQSPDTSFELVVRSPESYEIRGTDGGVSLTYASGTAIDAFIAAKARP